jgi:hypothetical protein
MKKFMWALVLCFLTFGGSFVQADPTDLPVVDPSLPRGQNLIDEIIRRTIVIPREDGTLEGAQKELRQIFKRIGRPLSDLETATLQNLIRNNVELRFFADGSKASGSLHLVEFGASVDGWSMFQVFLHESAHSLGDAVGNVADMQGTLHGTVASEFRANLIAANGDYAKAWAQTKKLYPEQVKLLLEMFPQLGESISHELRYHVLDELNKVLPDTKLSTTHAGVVDDAIARVRAIPTSILNTVARILRPIASTGTPIITDATRAIQKITVSAGIVGGKVLRILGKVAIPLGAYLSYRDFRDATDAYEYANAALNAVGIIPTPHTAVWGIFYAIGNLISETVVIPIIEENAKKQMDEDNERSAEFTRRMKEEKERRQQAEKVQQATVQLTTGAITEVQYRTVVNATVPECARHGGCTFVSPRAFELAKKGNVPRDATNFWPQIVELDRQERFLDRSKVVPRIDIIAVPQNLGPSRPGSGISDVCLGIAKIHSDPNRVGGPCDVFLPPVQSPSPTGTRPADICQGIAKPKSGSGSGICEVDFGPDNPQSPGSSPQICQGMVRPVSDPNQQLGPCDMFVPPTSPAATPEPVCQGMLRPVPPGGARGPCDQEVEDVTTHSPGLGNPAEVCQGMAVPVTDPNRVTNPCEIYIPESAPAATPGPVCQGMLRPVPSPGEVRGPCDVYVEPSSQPERGNPADVCQGMVRPVTDPANKKGPCDMVVPEKSPAANPEPVCQGVLRPKSTPDDVKGPCDVYIPPEAPPEKEEPACSDGSLPTRSNPCKIPESTPSDRRVRGGDYVF